tara:strand:- start:537 stop:1370 length:834 start_codon:yes stop_codon:yes gene_type:complete
MFLSFGRLLAIGPSLVVACGSTLSFASSVVEQVDEVDIGGASSVLTRAWESGFVVFSVLLCLVFFSILSWALIISKYLYLRKMTRHSDVFLKNFWDSRSLNDLNSRLGEYPYSPVKEVFRSGYAELVRGSQMREQAGNSLLGIKAAMENLGRSLTKASHTERKRLETYLPLLATIASSAPFIGLFGTVWGIMGAFEGIARSGSASLAAVAPGIAEALIATAFGLAAAIPAVMGYNLANSKIRGLMVFINGFQADFLNIVERYMVSDKSKTNASNSPI